jgi:hypothetical protein
MKIDGLWFNVADKKKMLRFIRDNIPLKDQKQAMRVVEAALNDSAGKGLSGEHSATATVESNGYQVIANVCCGGYADIVIKKVSTILP